MSAKRPGILARVETKVWAAVVGTGAGATVAAAILWGLGVWLWHVPADAVHADDAIAAVPGPLAALVGLIITVAGTAVGGWAAPPSNHAGHEAS